MPIHKDEYRLQVRKPFTELFTDHDAITELLQYLWPETIPQNIIDVKRDGFRKSKIQLQDVTIYPTGIQYNGYGFLQTNGWVLVSKERPLLKSLSEYVNKINELGYSI